MKLSSKNFIFDKIPFYLIVLLPALLVSGPFLADTALTICAVIFLINSYKNKLVSYYTNYFFYFFIFFYIHLNISALLSDNIIFSLKTSLPYLRFGIFALCTWYILEKNDQLAKYVLYSFLLVFLFLIIDGIYQYTFKINLFGYPLVGDRVSSLFGDELILGSFLSRNYPLFWGLFLFYFKKNKTLEKKNLIFYFTLIFLPILIIMSGERSSTFYFILSIIYIMLYIQEKKFFILSVISIIFIFLGIFLLENRFANRIINQTKNQLINDTKENNKKFNLFSQTHEEHYKSALKIFKDNLIFGSGPKSFRIKCSEERYLVSKTSCVTHPHNTYIQLMSETGIIGFCFVFFLFCLLCFFSIKLIYQKYILKKYLEPFKLCLFASFLITLWPIIPSGNFFTNWLNVVYYLPVGFFMWLVHKKKTI
jgi:O-antigen ligase